MSNLHAFERLLARLADPRAADALLCKNLHKARFITYCDDPTNDAARKRARKVIAAIARNPNLKGDTLWWAHYIGEDEDFVQNPMLPMLIMSHTEQLEFAIADNAANLAKAAKKVGLEELAWYFMNVWWRHILSEYRGWRADLKLAAGGPRWWNTTPFEV